MLHPVFHPAAWVAALTAGMIACSAGPSMAQNASGGDGSWMRRHDANRDGLIQRSEAPAAVARAFDALDADGDGVLSVRELLRGRAAAEARQSGGTPAPPAAPSTRPETLADPVDDAMQSLIASRGLAGAAVIVRRVGSDDDVERRYYGTYNAESRVPIASATKWFTGVAVAATAEQAGRSLDMPVGNCIPGLAPDRAAITVRQTLSHVSGLPSLGPAAERAHADLEASVASLMRLPAVGAPGEVFVYSGTAMQVAARCAEILAGKDFRTLFAGTITGPLGLTRTSFAAEGAPVTGGGLWSTPHDLEQFTAMIAGRGAVGDVRVLSPEAFDDISRLVSPAHARIVEIPDAARGFEGMATGMWCERALPSGACAVVSSAGAFGTYAWVDYEAGLYGVFVVQSRLPDVWPTWVAIRAALGSR